jgi:hypothetical protein
MNKFFTFSASNTYFLIKLSITANILLSVLHIQCICLVIRYKNKWQERANLEELSQNPAIKNN